MPVIYHIAREVDWRSAQERECYEVASLESQGYIHCSTAEQIVHIANALFRGESDLVLLVIDEDLVGPEVRYENFEGGDRLYPHVYGPLNVDAVVDAREFRPRPDGTFDHELP